MHKNLAISLIILAFLFGMGAGFALTPEYAAMRAAKTAPMMELGAADRNLDLRYVDGMIAHHLAAIDLLQQAQQHSKRPEILKLAETIIAADRKGIEQLYQHKKNWYNNTTLITKFQKVNLGSADEKFDLRLLNALLNHHDEAIQVAKQVRTKSTRTEVLTLADDVISSLSANAITLTQWRKEWYGIE